MLSLCDLSVLMLYAKASWEWCILNWGYLRACLAGTAVGTVYKNVHPCQWLKLYLRGCRQQSVVLLLLCLCLLCYVFLSCQWVTHSDRSRNTTQTHVSLCKMDQWLSSVPHSNFTTSIRGWTHTKISSIAFNSAFHLHGDTEVLFEICKYFV